MALLTILDYATAVAVGAATSQQANLEALLAPFGAGPVTARLEGPTGTHLRTLTSPLPTIEATTPRRFTLAAHLADAAVATGAPGRWVFRTSGGLPVFSIAAGTGGSSINHVGDVKTLCTPTLQGVVVTANSSLPLLGVPTYLQGRTPLQWFVASSNIVFTDPAVNADLDPAVNPEFYSATDSRAPWRRLFSLLGMTGAWGDGVFSDQTGEASIIGGGHGGYLGNERIGINCHANNPTFFRRGFPTGSIQHPISSWLPDPVPPNGANNDVTPDGRTKSVHSYSILAALPNGDVFQGPGGATDTRGVGGGFSTRAFIHRAATNDWDLAVVGHDPGKSPGYTVSEYDASRNLIWNFQGYRVVQFDRNTLAPTLVLSLSQGFDTTSVSCPDEDRDLIYFIGSGGSNMSLRIFNRATLAFSPADTPSPPATHPVTGLALPTRGPGVVFGAAYDRRRDRILVYSEGNTVYALTPPAGNRMVDPWVLSLLTTSDSVVNPGAQAGNGTWGRFWISERNNAAYALHALDRPLYCLPLEAV